MKVIVDFSKDKDLIGYTWVEDILNLQKIDGFIKVKKVGSRYLTISQKIPSYGLMPEWVKEVIEE